ncbi:MAG: isopentenyl-diphosphate Delta-isomerase [Lentimicrobium sp.]|nr:isopentenyl-diphosphate Delta-isomerase [Lentimicrobium sp.]
MEELVILVDHDDRETGVMEKIQAHREALLHRAFSVFVFNSKGELMLQQRALGKYHSPGLWTNTCCSHPRPGEDTEAAAHRRLHEEMGFDCTLTKIFHFTYKAPFDNNLTEHEVDHVFVGFSDTLPVINPEEVESYRFATLDDISVEMAENPELFTVWFQIAFERVAEYYLNRELKKS